ncbi:MAG: sigma-54 dependent transcriptional regulator [candidate division Zixibacteria bacterium]
MKKILIVDDEESQRELLKGYLSKNGYEVTLAGDGEEALAVYRNIFAPLALVDLKMPKMNGLELLVELKQINPFIQVIMLTAFGSVETAVAAMKAGATDYLTKPINDLEELLLKLNRASQQNELIVEAEVMRESLSDAFPKTEIIGESKVIKEVGRMMATVGPKDTTVLITGASGTGKELVARGIHALSGRADKNLVSLNCAALPETLLESELFGYEKGAFTGADKTKLGRFELAEGGTMFLDEIGEMSLSMQVKLLRVIEEHTIERLGSTRSISLDIRIIAATNRNLSEMIKEKAFREDLYYRLNVVEIKLPSLKERSGDILLIAKHFLEKFAKKHGKKMDGIDSAAAKILSKYHWPGNVRELENVLERAVILSTTSKINAADLSGLSNQSSSQGISHSEIPLAEVEKNHIEFCLKANDWNIGQTAEVLKIHSNPLSAKIKEYGLSENSQ